MKHPNGVLKQISIVFMLFSAALHANDPVGLLYALEPALKCISWDAYSGIARFIIVLLIGFEIFTAINWMIGLFNKRWPWWNIPIWLLGLTLALTSLILSEEMSWVFSAYLLFLLLVSFIGIIRNIILWRHSGNEFVALRFKYVLASIVLFSVSSTLPYYILSTQPIINTCAWKEGLMLESVFSPQEQICMYDSEGINYLPNWIKNDEPQLWIIVPHLPSSQTKVFNTLNICAVEAENHGVNVVGIAEGTASVLEDFRHEMQTPFPFYATSTSFMSNYTRSNPTVVLIAKKRIVNIWPASSLPTWNELKALISRH
jgi:hypothetical protein